MPGQCRPATSFTFTLETSGPAAPNVTLSPTPAVPPATKSPSMARSRSPRRQLAGRSSIRPTAGPVGHRAFRGRRREHVQVRQVDAAGNAGTAASFSFTLDSLAPGAPTVALRGHWHFEQRQDYQQWRALGDPGRGWRGGRVLDQRRDHLDIELHGGRGREQCSGPSGRCRWQRRDGGELQLHARQRGPGCADGGAYLGHRQLGQRQDHQQRRADGDPGRSGRFDPVLYRQRQQLGSSFSPAEGANTVQVRQLDAAGNAGTAASFTFTLDSVAPAAPTVALTLGHRFFGQRQDYLQRRATVTPAEAGGRSSIRPMAARPGHELQRGRGREQSPGPSGRCRWQCGGGDELHLYPGHERPSRADRDAHLRHRHSASDKITSNGALTVTPAEAGGVGRYSINGGSSWTSSFSASRGREQG